MNVINHKVYKGNLSETLSIYFQTHHYTKIFIITNSYLLNLYYEDLISCSPSLHQAEILEVDSGENCKNIEIVAGLWESLHQSEADRESLIIGFGGGTITDLSGFVASTYMRGIPFIFIPTTLLSQIDAAIGGKNGINFGNIKNLIGVIKIPDALFIDPYFLKSLSAEEITSGFAEMIKYGLALDKNYWQQIQNVKLPDISFNLIEEAINLKQAIIAEDLWDYNNRRKLNFGHSVGHALEIFTKPSKRPYRHGEAVSIGMVVAAHLSIKYCGLSSTDFETIYQFIHNNYRFPKLSQQEISTLISIMKSDKKNKNGQFNFTLIEKIGKSRINCFVTQNDIYESLDTILI